MLFSRPWKLSRFCSILYSVQVSWPRDRFITSLLYTLTCNTTVLTIISFTAHFSSTWIATQFKKTSFNNYILIYKMCLLLFERTIAKFLFHVRLHKVSNAMETLLNEQKFEFKLWINAWCEFEFEEKIWILSTI